MKHIKTIDINTLTWFDKINGNTYFANKIIVNYGLKSEKTFIQPFQYGYSSFDYKAIELVKKELNLNCKISDIFQNTIIRHNIYKSLKRDLINLSK